MEDKEYKNLKERLDLLIADTHILRDKILEEIAKLKATDHKLEEKMTSLENIIRLLGARR